MLIWTNDPYNSVWEHLNLFQSKDAVSQLLEGKFQSKRLFSYCDASLKETKAKQISYSIKNDMPFIGHTSTELITNRNME